MRALTIDTYFAAQKAEDNSAEKSRALKATLNADLRCDLHGLYPRMFQAEREAADHLRMLTSPDYYKPKAIRYTNHAELFCACEAGAPRPHCWRKRSPSWRSW